MDFIKQNIGPNKIYVPIRSNRFEETLAIDELFTKNVSSEFSKLDNLIDEFRAIRPYLKRNVEIEKQQNTKSNNITSPKLTTTKQIKDALAYTFMVLEDPTLSLIYDIDNVNSKIDNFKKNFVTILIDKFTSLGLAKESKDVNLFKIAIEDATVVDLKQRRLFFVFACHYLKVNLVIVDDNGKVFDKFFVEGHEGRCAIIDNTGKIKNDSLSFSELVSLAYKDINFDDLLAPDLKEIANSINTPIFKMVDGKKKMLLKAELKASIVKRIVTIV